MHRNGGCTIARVDHPMFKVTSRTTAGCAVQVKGDTTAWRLGDVKKCKWDCSSAIRVNTNLVPDQDRADLSNNKIHRLYFFINKR